VHTHQTPPTYTPQSYGLGTVATDVPSGVARIWCEEGRESQSQRKAQAGIYPQKENGENILGKYHVKFRHFANFFTPPRYVPNVAKRSI